MDLGRISIGLPGILDAATIRALAPLIETAGFHALWLNDTPGGDSLAGLAVAADVTTTLTLAAGVIPVDRRPAPAIARSLLALQLPADRTVIGLGSGSPADGVARVELAVATLRDATSAPILVGALGPRMRRLAAERADGVLLNWLTPAAAHDAADDLRRDAAGAPRPGAASRPARAVLYARTAVDTEALPALTKEAKRYERIPSYAANLKRIGATAMDTTIRPGELVGRATEYTAALDELVLRAIVARPSVDSYRRFIEAVAATE